MRARFGRLRERTREVLGINRRNLEYVLQLNPREHFPRADDKIEAKAILSRSGIPTPATLAIVSQRRDIDAVLATLAQQSAFAMKPAQGFGGQGVFVVQSDSSGWLDSGGKRLDEAELRFAMVSILAGMYSRNRFADRVLVEEKVEENSALSRLHGGIGVSDVRVIACRSRVVMAMLRLPCSGSRGTANLHAGGVGVGVDIESGTTTFAIRHGRPLERHPDTGMLLSGFRVPRWDHISEVAGRINEAFGLGYLGADIAIDERKGPCFLEVNARPGLAIQLANRTGLRGALQRTAAAD